MFARQHRHIEYASFLCGGRGDTKDSKRWPWRRTTCSTFLLAWISRHPSFAAGPTSIRSSPTASGAASITFASCGRVARALAKGRTEAAAAAAGGGGAPCSPHRDCRGQMAPRHHAARSAAYRLPRDGHDAQGKPHRRFVEPLEQLEVGRRMACAHGGGGADSAPPPLVGTLATRVRVAASRERTCGAVACKGAP